MWIKIKGEDTLPPMRQYVIAKHNRGTWIDPDDQVNVNTVVVKRVEAKIEGNNEVPYEWVDFGPDRYFGQTITHWMAIPQDKD